MSVEFLSGGAVALLLILVRRRTASAVAVTLLAVMALSTCVSAPRADPVFYFHNDRLGIPLRLTNEAGQTVWRAEYRPFGDLESVDTDVDGDGVAVENNLRFPGQYNEGLFAVLFAQGPYYNWNRMYDPELGRYLSPDPLVASPADSQLVKDGLLYAASWGLSIASFTYAGSRPNGATDPSGLNPCWPSATGAPIAQSWDPDSNIDNLWTPSSFNRTQQKCTCSFKRTGTYVRGCTCSKGTPHTFGTTSRVDERISVEVDPIRDDKPSEAELASQCGALCRKKLADLRGSL